MEPRENSQDKHVELATPEQLIVSASLNRLKTCGVPEIRTDATWADISITKDTSGNKTRIIPFTSEEKTAFPTVTVRLVMTGDSPDEMHFQLHINADKFSEKSDQETDIIFVPYFTLVSSFEKAITAESLDIVNSDITYADNYMAVYNQAFEMQFRYKEWLNLQAAQSENPPDVLPYPDVMNERINTQQNLYEYLYGKLPEGTPKINFGIREYLLMINDKLPQIYRRLQERGEPLLQGEGLVGNPAAQQDFLSELSMLLVHYRQPDETFEQAVIATISHEMLEAFHDPINLEPLSALINESAHPLRSFIFVRAKLYEQAVAHALGLYYSVELPDAHEIRDFVDTNVGPIDLAIFGAIATGDLYLDRLDQGYRNFGFGENDRKTS